MVDGVEDQRKKLKTSQQKVRRLQKQVVSFQNIIQDLKEKMMLTEQAAENISASFAGPAAELVQRCVEKSLGGCIATYPTWT